MRTQAGVLENQSKRKPHTISSMMIVAILKKFQLNAILFPIYVLAGSQNVKLHLRQKPEKRFGDKDILPHKTAQ